MKRLVVILAGGLIQNSNSSWRTTRFDEPGDTSGALGDYVRVYAGAFLYGDDPEHTTLLASGGKGYKTLDKEAPMLSDVIAGELEQLGVPKSVIQKEAETNSSIEQLEYIATQCIVDYEKIVIVSNRYHIERLQAMIDYFEKLHALRTDKVSLVSAEEVVLAHDKLTWEPIITTVYQSESMQSRIASEKKGVQDIKNGTYKI